MGRYAHRLRQLRGPRQAAEILQGLLAPWRRLPLEETLLLRRRARERPLAREMHLALQRGPALEKVRLPTFWRDWRCTPPTRWH